MNWWQTTLVVVLIVAVDLAIVGSLLSICGSMLKPIVAAFPPAQPKPDAVARRFQSFRFGMMNFGCCVHVLADEHCLHLRPAWLARLAGLREISIPWEAIRLGSVRGKWAQATVLGCDVRGPAWCLSLAGSGGEISSSEPRSAR